jgi:predicted metal-dependent peptidase
MRLYDVDRGLYDKFVEECKEHMDRLGIKAAPVTYIFDKPPAFTGSNILACSVRFRNNQKLAMYLNPKWHRKPSSKCVEYLAYHEPLEVMLEDEFKAFAHKCVRTRKFDDEVWRDVVHSAINRIISLIDPDLLVDSTDESWIKD